MALLCFLAKPCRRASPGCAAVDVDTPLYSCYIPLEGESRTRSCPRPGFSRPRRDVGAPGGSERLEAHSFYFQ